MWVPPSAQEAVVTVRFEDLPKSLFPVRTVPLSQHNPEEVRRLADRPQRLLPPPEDSNPGRARRLANLAQYRGRSAEGQQRALGNMPRKTKADPVRELDMSTITQQPPSVPTATPIFTNVEDTFRGQLKRRVVSQDEWKLYVYTWNEYLTKHPEWDMPEDHDDLHQICMETVLMFRAEQYEANNPGKKRQDEYDRAFVRKEKARQNLTARRVDRVGSKARGNHTTQNIAILAGQVSDQQLIERNQKMADRRSQEQAFLTSTRPTDLLISQLPSEPARTSDRLDPDEIDGEIIEAGPAEPNDAMGE